SELGPRTREHGGSGVDHDGHPKPLRGLVDRAERRQPSVHVPVRGEELMGGMDLHAAHLPLRGEAFHVPLRILRPSRMDRTEREQTLAVLAGEFPDEAVYVLSVAYNIGSVVVD